MHLYDVLSWIHHVRPVRFVVITFTKIFKGKIFVKQETYLNKNTLGAKECNQKQQLLIKKFDIKLRPRSLEYNVLC